MKHTPRNLARRTVTVVIALLALTAGVGAFCPPFGDYPGCTSIIAGATIWDKCCDPTSGTCREWEKRHATCNLVVGGQSQIIWLGFTTDSAQGVCDSNSGDCY